MVSLTDNGLPLISETKELTKHGKLLKKSITTSAKGKKFEDEVGLLLFHLSPLKLSTHPFFVELKSGKKFQIDVLAVFPETIIVVECKAGENHDIASDLGRINSNCGELSNLVRNYVENGKSFNVVFILSYSDKLPIKKDFSHAEHLGIKLIDRKIFDSYFQLAKSLKDSARDIIFSDWLKGKDIKSLPKNEKLIPAMKSKFGSIDCFCFVASPYLLKKLCYVQRRHIQHTLDKKGISYQRLIKPQKIKSIKKYLLGGEFFPTSVLLNFDNGLELGDTKESKAEMAKANPNIEAGWIQPPKKHGCAMVIDGQHRIYGYSGLDQLSKDHSINVIAFSRLKCDKQAKMFSDINETQTPIDKDVLWDLYEDILPEEENKYKIAIAVKRLNDKSKYFLNRVFIPSKSLKSKSHYPLSINSLCRTLSSYQIVFRRVLDENEDTYFRILDKYFNDFLDNPDLKKDWEDLNNSFLLSNNGFEILILVLNYFYDYLIKSEVDIKNISDNLLFAKLADFNKVITESLVSISPEKLRGLLKRSSTSAKKEVRNEIITRAGKYSPVFQKIAAMIFLQEIKEDGENELKETLRFDKKKSAPSDDLFNEAILGTISSWINAQKNGNLFIGVADDNKIVGLEEELFSDFDNNLDSMKKYIENKIESNLFTKDFDKMAIEINEYLGKPLVIHVFVPKSDKGVAIVGYIKNGKKDYLALRKTSTGKRRIKDYAAELGAERGANLGTLIGNFSQS